MPAHYHIRTLSYHADTAAVFTAIRHLPGACWLDSGKPDSLSGRYDILTAQPTRRWVTKDDTTYITDYQYTINTCSAGTKELISSLHTQQTSHQDPLTLLKHACATLVAHHQDTPLPDLSLPFMGGIVSYVTYTLGRQHLNISPRSKDDCQIPSMIVGWYPWAIIQDHETATCYLVALPECDSALLDYIEQVIRTHAHSSAGTPAAFSIGKLSSNINQQEYYAKMAAINDYIHAGDCYQVNFAQRFSASYQGDPYIAYATLRQKMSSPFSAFMDISDLSLDTSDSAPQKTSPQAILSFSPERFLQVKNRHVLTQPIKGTIARNNDPIDDQKNALHLQQSQKNRAENVMIVDLLRNDLGKNCIPGSIHVPALFALESFPNVHHLVSNVEGTLQEDSSAVDLFNGCFPGGSITGAPKKRAMEIIEELEDSQRAIYCGSIAYFTSWGDMDSNITIRTIACDGENAYCWGGGGIVADSDPEDEYQESLTKINKILHALQQFNSES